MQPRGGANAPYGFQAGLQKFGYAMVYMNDAALGYLNKSGGWEVGSAPRLVVVDTGWQGRSRPQICKRASTFFSSVRKVWAD
jgi:hypothetical protein